MADKAGMMNLSTCGVTFMRIHGVLFLSAWLPLASAPQLPVHPGTSLPDQFRPGPNVLAQRAAAGDAAAQFFMGRSCSIGADMPIDHAEAAKWFRKAAAQGHVDAQCELAFLLAAGAGLPKDPADALRWYRLAAAHGHAAALDSLGVMLSKGEGTQVDRVLGLACILEARALVGGEFSTGAFEQQMTGEAITQAKREAVAFLRDLHPLSALLQPSSHLPEPVKTIKETSQLRPLPAEDPDRPARFLLGTAAQDASPSGVQRRIQLMKSLAAQGSPHAQTLLARAYETGAGVDKDHAVAAQWYRKAAERGNADAQYNLAMMYAEGDGVTKDSDEAQKWFRAAAASVTPFHPMPPDEKLQYELDHRNTRLGMADGAAYRFFLIARYAGNPEAQALLDSLDKGLSRNVTAACRYYAEFVWVRIRPE